MNNREEVIRQLELYSTVGHESQGLEHIDQRLAEKSLKLLIEMSDTCIAAVSQNRKNIDIIDEQWMTDCLSDDEIDMPKDMEENADDDEEESSPESAEDAWTDTGLEIFAVDLLASQNLITPPQPQPQAQTQPQQQPHSQ